MSCKARRALREMVLGMSSDLTMSLGWVIAYVDDPAAAAEFYERTFGMSTDFVVPGDMHSWTRARRSSPLRPTRSAKGTSPTGFAARRATASRRTWRSRWCTRTWTPRTHARSRPAANRSRHQDKPQGQRVAFVRDPFGTLVELATPL
jgi:catechol 2,3-dioxygenase-like lactoylglutathione lyase family enzyme